MSPAPRDRLRWFFGPGSGGKASISTGGAQPSFLDPSDTRAAQIVPASIIVARPCRSGAIMGRHGRVLASFLDLSPVSPFFLLINLHTNSAQRCV